MRETVKANNDTGAAKAAARGGWGFLGLWLPVSAFWLLIALPSLLDALLFHPNDTAQALRFFLLQWLPWAFVAPVIMWISFAYTLERSTWRRNLWVHLATCVIIVGGLAVLAYCEGPPPFGRGTMKFVYWRGPGPWGGSNAPGPFSGGSAILPLSGPNAPPGPFSGTSEHFPPPRGGRPLGGPPPPPFPILRLATFILPTFWAFWGVAQALRFYQRSKDRERHEAELESRLVQARLQALRMQLNPHFLFNTLNSIASLVYEEPQAADEMIGSLSELLRLALDDSTRQEITLREELNFLDKYLLIEQARFGERLRIEKEIEPEALDATVPILILQPLVENAVKHGIEMQLAPGVIRVVAKKSGEKLLLQVADNGRGAEAATDGNLKEGVGLSNTRSRLKELYGENALLAIRAGETGGFLAEIQIPWRTKLIGQTVSATVA
jgi:two-component sensor histidine kinase